MFTVFTWTLHKPAGCTIQYFWFIISSVGGCEVRQEVGTEGKKKTLLKYSACTRFTAHPNFLIGGHDTCWAASTHPVTDPVLSPPKINYFQIISCAKLLFRPGCLPKGGNNIPRLIWLNDLKTENNTPPRRQPGYSSNKKLPQQSRLLWLQDKLWKMGKVFKGAALSSVVFLLGSKQYVQPTNTYIKMSLNTIVWRWHGCVMVC